MRIVPAAISNLVEQGGPFIGEDGAPHTRVTIEETWRLRKAYQAGNFRKTPVRWWQRADNSQNETEIPNIARVSSNRSIDQDAATATIVLGNQWHYHYGFQGDLNELGRPGYFTFNRGDEPDAVARWDHVVNSWNGVLLPNSLIRTYQGYGGKDKSVEDAVADGNIVLTGVWLVDSVSISTDGLITLDCRDMCKLLIDQFLYPPLVPDRWYPLSYCRYDFPMGSNPAIIYGEKGDAPFDRAVLGYRASTGDLAGANTEQSGYRPTAALNQSTEDYWLSPGASASNKWHYYEINVNEPIQFVGWVPRWGNYTMYVSVMENGVWQGSETISAPTSDYPDTTIKYVKKTGIAWETSNFGGGGALDLGRVYQATRVRFTFTNLVRTEVEGVTFRVAMRELAVGHANTNLPTKKIMGGASTDNNQGYWLVGSDGGVFGIGPDAQFYGSSGGGGTDNPWTGMDTAVNTGYWTVRKDGKVYAFGSLPFLGDRSSGPESILDIAAHGDDGYWLLASDGAVFAFGTAGYQGRGSTGGVFYLRIVANGDGYYLLRSDGVVEAFGATHYGNGPSGARGLGVTGTGNGYWIVTGAGEVYSYGDAVYSGGPNQETNPPLADTVSDIFWSRNNFNNQAYTVIAEDGGVFNYGGSSFYGSLPKDYSWTTRIDGNYKDYADIIKELLLWSGWWLYDPTYPSSAPPEVYGNIETTGIFNEDEGKGCIPEEMLDKVSVIDAITGIKEIVGYNFWVDEEGGARFELPNWYLPGNYFQETGAHTRRLPLVDERTNLTNLTVNYTDAPVRSEIIISTADPEADLKDTKSSRLTIEELSPESAELLRGMVKPMMWVNETFQKQKELDLMAERVALQILFNQRKAQIECVFNPEIQINDQIQVYERVTAETYIHYVRGVSVEHDLLTGTMRMSLETHWLGPGDDPVILPSWEKP